MTATNPGLPELPFEIRTLQSIRANQPEKLSSPEKAARFEIIWMQNESTVYCIDIGQVRSLRQEIKPEGYYISFSPQFLYLSEDLGCPLFGNGRSGNGTPRIIHADEELEDDMEEIIGKMVKESARCIRLRSEVLKGLLRILMIYLSRRFPAGETEPPTGRHKLVDDFMQLLEKNLTQRKRVREYARELQITPNHLNVLVKACTGYPVKYHINQRIILEAKRQIIHNRISMKEVAYHLGFSDIAHFSKFFKANTGLNFQTFKKELDSNN